MCSIYDVRYVLHTTNCTYTMTHDHIAYTMMLHTAHYTQNLVMTCTHTIINNEVQSIIVQSYMSLLEVESFTSL